MNKIIVFFCTLILVVNCYAITDAEYQNRFKSTYFSEYENSFLGKFCWNTSTFLAGPVVVGVISPCYAATKIHKASSFPSFSDIAVLYSLVPEVKNISDTYIINPIYFVLSCPAIIGQSVFDMLTYPMQSNNSSVD